MGNSLTKANTSALNKCKGRGSIHGDAQWTELAEICVDAGEVFALEYTDLSPEVLTVLKTHEGGGGGYSNAAEKMGRYSHMSNSISWTLNCRSKHAWGCPHKMKVGSHLQFTPQPSHLSMFTAALFCCIYSRGRRRG